jgi:inositol oxygenase
MDIIATQFRDYENTTKLSVKEFYRLNHLKQTVAFNQQQREKYLPLRHKTMSVWQALHYLDAVIDTSDPDTELTQLEHALQTAEAIRSANLPRWFILTGLIHDLGKVLTLFGEPQWAVVGDTFPVGCHFAESNVYPDFFQENTDVTNTIYQSKYGIYSPHCGLENVLMSWGHDEYLYHVVKNYLPEEALYIIRYHSFYPWHKHDTYLYLTNEKDQKMLPWIKQFNLYDLYSKADTPPNIKKLMPFYHELIREFLPEELRW